MRNSSDSIGLRLHLLHTGKCQVGNWWKYKNVLSPFNRMYYIHSGEGKVFLKGETYQLTEGKIFLIPKFIPHAYQCDESMEQTYICFTDELIGNRNIYDLVNFSLLKDADHLIKSYFDRIVALNPYRTLKAYDPKIYDNNKELLFGSSSSRNIKANVETSGILLQLFSTFIEGNIDDKESQLMNKQLRLNKVLNHIVNHLHERITVSELAELMCLSTDHFSILFKKIMGLRPNEYLQLKRIEQAQILLSTTDIPIQEIARKVGIENPSRFSTLFSQYNHMSPGQYRKTSQG